MNQLQSSVIILAAGLSERMGKMKPLLRFNEQQNFLEHIIDEYSRIIKDEIIVVVNSKVSDEINIPNNPKVKFIINDNPYQGRMSSVILGIQALRYRRSCFIHNVDNPFVTYTLMKDMENRITENSCVMPFYNDKGGHPILFGEKIIAHISEAKSDDDFRKALTPYECIHAETDDEKILININTKNEYHKYFKYIL